MREGRERVNYNGDQKVAFFRLFSFANRFDTVLMIVGTISAVANGLAQPLMMLTLGNLVNSFGTSVPSTLLHNVSKVLPFLSRVISRHFFFFFNLHLFKIFIR